MSSKKPSIQQQLEAAIQSEKDRKNQWLDKFYAKTLPPEVFINAYMGPEGQAAAAKYLFENNYRIDENIETGWSTLFKDDVPISVFHPVEVRPDGLVIVRD